MSEIEITSITKDSGYRQNAHEAITSYGWKDTSGKTGRNDRKTMVALLEQGVRAYVRGARGTIVYCSVRSSVGGIRFLQTQAEGEWTSDLLNLPEDPR